MLIGLMVGNAGLWGAKTFKWRRVTEDLRNGEPLEMPTIAKLIKIKVLLHQFYFTLYVPFKLNFASKIYK